jgi:hypothetical protein
VNADEHPTSSATGEFGARRLPVEAPGDHKMDHQPLAAFQAHRDALAHAAVAGGALAGEG